MKVKRDHSARARETKAKNVNYSISNFYLFVHTRLFFVARLLIIDEYVYAKIYLFLLIRVRSLLLMSRVCVYVYRSYVMYINNFFSLSPSLDQWVMNWKS
jgi:hypothetical protein